MTTDDPGPDRGHSFGSVAAAYDAGRPSFPAEALVWLLGPQPRQVLDLGAGTGKLTAVAAALGHHVVAVDPSEEMLAVCQQVPGVVTMVGAAESIPLAQDSVDAVIAGQAFHWFDHARALPEIARVLRPHGVLGLLWNHYDTVVPWVRRLNRAILGEDFLAGSDRFDPMTTLLQSDLFGPVETGRFRHWHDLDREALRQLALSHSRVAVLAGSRREAVLEQVDAIYDGTARPPEPLRMPYFADCYRAGPSELAAYRPVPPADPTAPAAPDEFTGP